MSKIPERMSAFKRTHDEWYGNYKMDVDYDSTGKQVDTKLVQVSLLKLNPYKETPTQWRVCVWGNDDFGMEKDHLDKAEALDMFHEVISWDFVNVGQLKSKGFVNA